MSINIGLIEIEENFDKDDELEISMRDATYYFTKSQIETLRDHLTKVLGNRTSRLEEELAGWMKSYEDLNQRLIAMTEFYEG